MQPIQYLGDQQSPIQKVIAAKRIQLQQKNANRGLDQRDRAMDTADEQRAIDNQYRTDRAGVSDTQTGISNDLRTRQIDLSEGREERLIRQLEEEKATKVSAAKAKQKAIADFAARPNKTGKDYADMIAANPELSKDIKASWDILNSEAQREQMESASQIYAAVSSGNNDVAKNLLNERASAADAAGDKKGAAGAKAMIQIIDSNPEAAKSSMGIFLASVTDGSKLAYTLNALEGNKPKAAKAKAAAKTPKTTAGEMTSLSEYGTELGLDKKTINRIAAKTRGKPLEERRVALDNAAEPKTPQEAQQDAEFPEMTGVDLSGYEGKILNTPKGPRKVVGGKLTKVE